MLDLTSFILSREFTTAVVNKQAGKTVEIESSSGHIDEDSLKSLLESNASTLLVDDRVFRLSRIEGDMYKYLNTMTEGSSVVVNMTEISLDKNTGDFTLKDLIVDQSSVAELKQIVETHINNTSIHVSTSDRNDWDDRVTANVPVGTEILNLTNLRN